MTLLGTRIGNIHLVDVLDQGGMGEIYVGIDEKLGRKVAVKSLRHDRGVDEQRRIKLLREARILSQLRHPHICQIYDFIEGKDRDFLVLELIEGRTLKEALENEPLDDRLKAKIAVRIAEVLVATHAEGIVHRDLKPANVMLTEDDDVKVLDFGVARLADLESAGEAASPLTALGPEAGDSTLVRFSMEYAEHLDTGPGGLPGTPQYMSPEQARSAELTTASDLYSFGLLLQELFTGRPPYPKGLPLYKVLLRASKGESLPVEGLDGELARLIGRLKSFAPGARPSAVDTLERLERFRRRSRRRVKRLVVAALLAVVFAVGAVVTWEARSAARRAEGLARLTLSRHLATQAALRRSAGERDLAFLLALEAEGFAATVEARSALLAGLEGRPLPAAAARLAWNAAGDGIATGGASGRLAAWDASSTAPRFGTGVVHPGGVSSLAAGGGVLASGGGEGTIRLWSWDGTPRAELPGVHAGAVNALAWSADGELLASAGADGTIRLWTSAGEPFGAVLDGHQGEVRALVWDRVGDRLVSGGADGTVRLWDPLTGVATLLPLRGPAVSCLALDPDGRRLAVGDGDGGIRWWDLATGTAGAAFAGHEDEVRDVEWSPAAEVLASVAGDGAVLWDVASGEPWVRLSEGQGPAVDLAWSPDGRRLAAAGPDEVRVYEAGGSPEAWRRRACEAAGRNLTADEWRRLVGPELPYHETCPARSPAGPT